MNIMRKLRSGAPGSPSGPGGGAAPSTEDSSQHLGVMHLKKLFAEFSHSVNHLNEKEKDDKLYNMLPLFCKVFGNSNSADMTDKFRDVHSFCDHVSRLMVSKVCQRASNQSTEIASCAIAKFLEIENSEESSSGWMLLSTLNLMAAGDVSLVEVMTKASLPSTLVKCLYLFFDLPLMNEEEANMTDDSSDFTPRERRILLQKIFVQLLVRLCSHAAPAEELSNKDDLALLFSAITSVCPPYNVIWRKSAAEILMTLSSHSLTPKVVQYVHDKGCIALCIENMTRKKGQDLTPLEIVEMFVSVFCFLKDSSEVSQILLKDFKEAHGYTFLKNFLINLEHDRSSEAQEAVRNLVLMIATLSMCGYVELRPNAASMGCIFTILGFCMPQPSGRGSSVRNIHAFEVLHSVFLKSSSPWLCGVILDGISSIYHADNANYFILETQNSLPQFAERIHGKSPEIQEKFFQLIEFIVFHLNFVPCKELVSMSLILKTQHSKSSSVLCMKSLLNILKYNAVFKDVYREVGLLEVFASCLQSYKSALKAQISSGKLDVCLSESDETLASLIIEALVILLNNNSNNASVFRACKGALCVHELVLFDSQRSKALSIIRELMMNSGGDEDMSSLLATLHNAPPEALKLKSHILKSLLVCLKESHRARTIFRKVTGFVYVMSVLVSMERCLTNEHPDPPWSSLSVQDIFSLVHTVFHTLAVAMRFEPANAKYFHEEICLTSLCDTLRLLGCFSSISALDEYEETSCISLNEETLSRYETLFDSLFASNISNINIPPSIPAKISYACLILRLLYDVATDTMDKSRANISFKSPSHKCSKVVPQASQCKRGNSLDLPLVPPAPEPTVVHPGIVLAMLHLLPSIYCTNEPQVSLYLQIYSSHIIKSLARSERNQQLMCDIGMPYHLLRTCKMALLQESHPLHLNLQYMLERLASQSLQPKDLREFLRLGDPLCCIPVDNLDSMLGRQGEPVPLTRIKTLVSMTTPRDIRSHNYAGFLISPPFVEMDMSSEGFGCLYLPSIAPQSPLGVPSVATLTSVADTNVIGGIGSGDRIFPPQTGLSFSTWFCVDRYSDSRSDSHCVRLLTVIRNPQHTSRDDHLVCLTVVLSARDKAIIVSTQETPLSYTGPDWEPEDRGESCARVWCPDLLQEGQWHHLVIVLNRAVLKNSSFSLYVDGQHIKSQKMHYISQNPGGGGVGNVILSSFVYAYIGTPPAWRSVSKLSWKQGACHLIEEVLNPHIITAIYQLGPHYISGLQAPPLQGDCVQALVPEEKIIFGLNARAKSQLTLAKIRKVYSKIDSKFIAKQHGMSSHENATPIRILHNSAAHLSGTARSLGAVVVGYLGVRVFIPRPVAKVIDSIGGCSILLGLIAMAQDIESLYAGVKALVCVVKSNKVAEEEMDRRRGYQTLAMLLCRKQHLLNSHILHLTFSLVGTVDSRRESSSIPNPTAFQDLLCDVDMWHSAPGELQRSLFEHLNELVAESNEKRANLRIVQEMNIVPRLLQMLTVMQSVHTRQVLVELIGALLANQPIPSQLLEFGQFVVSTLPCSDTSEEGIPIEEGVVADNAKNIILRNRCLELLHSLLFTVKNTVNLPFCEVMVQTLGFDWVLLFLQTHLHTSTVILGMRILLVLGCASSLVQRFREGSSNGGWLKDVEFHLAHNKLSVLASPQIGAVSKSRDIRNEALTVPGFQHVSWLLPAHLRIQQVYFLLIALLMGQPVKHLPDDSKLELELDNIWDFVFGIPVEHSFSTVSSKITICQEAISVLLRMVRAIMNGMQEDKALEGHPITLIQFLFILYHNMSSDFMPVFITADVLSSLVSTLFPFSESVSLTENPANKFVMDFLRSIIVDSLSLPVTSKSSPILDLVLDGTPENATPPQISKFQTEILTSLMDHLLAADILIGEQAALPVVSGGNTTNIASNVCYLTSRIVDKLWQGSLSKDALDIFDFIIKLISQAKRKHGTTSSETLYHCLNRTILFLLSRNTESIAEQMPVLETLQKLTTHRSLIFGSGNHELDFFGCLTYCLTQLALDMKISLDSNGKTTWHVPSDSNAECTTQQGQNLLAVAAKRVWDELYVCKKPAIEEVFKCPLPQPVNGKSPDLALVQDQIQEQASKLWLNYIDAEKKSNYRMPLELHTQIQSKIQKVTGGLTRLASRSKVKKEDAIKIRNSRLTGPEMKKWTLLQVGNVTELVQMQVKQRAQGYAFMQRYVLEEWLQIETELTRERGVWGPEIGSRLDKWMLDTTEGPSRMRKKMMRNDMFYIHYPYRPELDIGDNKSLKYRVACSWDSKEYYKKYRPQSLIELEKEIIVTPTSEDLYQTVSPNPNTSAEFNLDANFAGLRRVVKRSVSEPDEVLEEDNDETEQEQAGDDQTLIRLLESHDKLSHMLKFRCARIQGLDTAEGILLFGKEHLYIVDGFTIFKFREIRDIESIAADEYEAILPSPGGTPQPKKSKVKRLCSKFLYEDIREVHKRRYLLQPMALEVFSTDGRNTLLAFPIKMRNKIYSKFMAFATCLADSAHQSVAGQKRTANVEQGGSLLSNLIGETSVTQRWVRGEISNFQYLMHLNTLAGRSYNDLMQYPVFPWILSDYDSPEIDLTVASTFRDFSKPMGAQTSDRLSQFRKRYREWDDPNGETPPYHYGTHYSSAMIVCSYLVRMEPFTQHFLRLQGGHFDLADRMFNSIKEAWYSASKHNMADVKELIPEFFYLPEFLSNSNNFDLGCKQNGVELGDVVLPPWAKDDPREFIRMHRLALESDYVSNHLHEWIDLIFGYKQTGPPAVEATNVFHHLFYEGKNNDIYNIDDPLKKNVIIGFINNFGQIPKQLFKKPHPSKKVAQRSSVVDPIIDKIFYHHLDNLKPSLQPIKEVKGPVGQVLQVDGKNVLVVEQNKVLIPPAYNRTVAWGFADHSLRINSYETDKALVICENVAQLGSEIVACVCASAKLIITAGTSTVVTMWELCNRQLKILQCLHGHMDAVTCLAASAAYNVIVSGSRDQTAIVWDLSRKIFVRQLRHHSAPLAAVAINELTGDIATCAGTWLHVWSINGDPLALVNTCVGRADRMQQILCVAFSQTREWDAANVVITGSTDGVVRMWSMEYIQIPKQETPPELDVMSEGKIDLESIQPEPDAKQKIKDRLVKQMSVSMTAADLVEVEESKLVKSGSESSLSDHEGEKNKEDEEQGDSQVMNPEPAETDASISESLNVEEPPVPVVRRRKSSAKNNLFRKSEYVSRNEVDREPKEEATIRPSKSDTSLTDSFVVVDSEGEDEVPPSLGISKNNPFNTKKLRNEANVLREGFRWQRQLVFRSKLTMHTAYDRKDNTEPASITALSISRDHRTVYVGDARGRVFSWCLTEAPGRSIADHWLKDEGAESCPGCGVKFSIYERKHHCRNCGQVFCSKCSRYESEISRLRILKPVRVCQRCHSSLRLQQKGGGT
uniref:WD repeat and FYVE domain-containing protein 3 n=1 Tax=Cacopsylla melanoneura TaxID=428564 RepID=A0A8D8WKM9_9HEMI